MRANMKTNWLENFVSWSDRMWRRLGTGAAAHLLSLLLFTPLILGNSAAGCANAFSESANKKTPEALLYQARMHLDKSEWTEAINVLNTVAAAEQSSREYKVTKASAYAGRCGLNLISLAEDIATQLAGTKLYTLLMNHMREVSSYADCTQAEHLLTSIAAGEMTSDDYVFLAFVSFAKIGAVLESSGADKNGDGAVDLGPAPAAFNACTNDADNILTADVRELGASLFIAYNAIVDSGISIASQLTSIMSGGSGICSSFDCSQTSPSDFDANEVAALRTLIKTTEIGLSTCSGTLTTPACICPP